MQCTLGIEMIWFAIAWYFSYDYSLLHCHRGTQITPWVVLEMLHNNYEIEQT